MRDGHKEKRRQMEGGGSQTERKADRELDSSGSNLVWSICHNLRATCHKPKHRQSVTIFVMRPLNNS